MLPKSPTLIFTFTFTFSLLFVTVNVMVLSALIFSLSHSSFSCLALLLSLFQSNRLLHSLFSLQLSDSNTSCLSTWYLSHLFLCSLLILTNSSCFTVSSTFLKSAKQRKPVSCVQLSFLNSLTAPFPFLNPFCSSKTLAFISPLNLFITTLNNTLPS